MSRERLPIDLPQIVVDDPWRRCPRSRARGAASFVFPLVGVTGSNGKTTIKEMIGSILAQLRADAGDARQPQQPHRRAADAARADRQHRYAVIEMGANHLGEIAHLARHRRSPTVGIVTNAGAAHLEGFGSLQGVATGKGEMFQALPVEGVAVDQCRRSVRAAVA